MKVLHVVSRSQRRGAERAALDLSNALAERSCESRIVSLARGHDGRELAELPSLTASADNGWRTFLSQVRALRRELAHERVDIVVAHGGRAAEVAVCARRGRHPLIVWQRILAFPAGIRRPHRRLWWRFMAGRIDAVVALNEQLETEVRTIGFTGPVWIIPNFRDTRRFDALDRERASKELHAQLGVDTAAPLVGFVGHLIEQKRPDRALDVIVEIHRLGEADAHLVVVGDGPLRAEIENQVHARRLNEYVHILGEHADVERLLAGMDVFVLTSDDEGIPGVLIEAQLAGCCVVAPDIGGIASLVDDGVTGFLCGRSDASELARTVVEALRDSDRGRQIGEHARKFAERFSADNAAREYETRFNALTNGYVLNRRTVEN